MSTQRNTTKSPGTSKRTRTPMSPEARENQLVSLAMDLAEERLRNKKATSQEIVYWLKVGSSKEYIERQILEKQASLVDAKTEAYGSSKRIEEMMNNALDAMKRYSGQGGDNETY